MKLVLALAAAGYAIGLAARAAEPPGVPANRIAALSPGINMAAPFYRPDTEPAPLVARIAAAGFRHVRLPVAPGSLLDEEHPDRLKPEGVQRLDATLDLLLHAGLAVSVDPHDPDKRLWTDPAYQDKFVAFWGALAKHLSRRDPDKVFLEVVNEPTMGTPEAWQALQGRILTAMRRGAPRQTLIATPNMLVSPGHWDQLAALNKLKPYGDRNVVYTFHYYNPFWFTHQSATWTNTPVKDMRQVPYPSSPEAVAAVMDKQQGDETKNLLRAYGEERWGAARIREDLQPYAEWARRNKVPIYCGELGVYKAVSPQEDRLQWYRDVVAALRPDGIPWTIWDDGGGFGTFAPRAGGWTTDTALLKALGMPQK